MFNLLKEYILLEIKEASFQDILSQIKDENENENEDENNPDDEQQGTEIENFKILNNMGVPYNPLKAITNNQKRSETK